MREGAKQTRSSVRLFFLVARAARTAVVFRRGPAKQAQMLRWDLASDVITPGQWISGRLYNERCDLSPNGKLLVYFCGKFKKTMDTFTAVCRPPYFTALALWPDSGTWGGGGFFMHDRRLVLSSGSRHQSLKGGAEIPEDFEVLHWSEHHRRGEGPTGLDGWIEVAKGVDAPATETMRVVFDPPWVHEKVNPRHARLVLERRWLGMFEQDGPASVHSWRLVDRGNRGGAGEPALTEALGRLDWAEWDHDGSLLLGVDGCLLRRRMLGSLAGAQAPAQRIADLRDHVFSNVIAPDSARRWP